MKRYTLIVTGILALLAAFLIMPSYAADEITVTGMGTCAKCGLHETEKCQTVIQVEKDGKTTTYYLKKNDLVKDFHENVCKAPEKVTATGTVSTKDGKEWMKVSKIELVK